MSRFKLCGNNLNGKLKGNTGNKGGGLQCPGPPNICSVYMSVKMCCYRGFMSTDLVGPVLPLSLLADSELKDGLLVLSVRQVQRWVSTLKMEKHINITLYTPPKTNDGKDRINDPVIRWYETTFRKASILALSSSSSSAPRDHMTANTNSRPTSPWEPCFSSAAGSKPWTHRYDKIRNKYRDKKE